MRISEVDGPAITSRALRPYLSDEGFELRRFVLRVDGVEAGFVEVDAAPGRFEITRLAVARRFRARGIGRRLLAHAERVAKRRGYRSVQVRAHSLDPGGMGTRELEQWYRRCGYLPVIGPSFLNVLRKPL